MTSKQIVEQKLDDALYIDMPSTKFNPKLYNQDYSNIASSIIDLTIVLS